MTSFQTILDISEMTMNPIEEVNFLSVPGKIPQSQSMDSVRSCSSAVITLDQIKRKAEEIVERKNSFCSSRLDTENDNDTSIEDDEEEEENTPVLGTTPVKSNSIEEELDNLTSKCWQTEKELQNDRHKKILLKGKKNKFKTVFFCSAKGKN